MMRKWILNIHLYGGLICSSYLILLGLSTFIFNHHLAPDRSKLPEIIWQRPLTVPVDGDDMEVAAKARDALGLIGWPLPWEMYRESNNDLRFDLARPGKYYTIHLMQDEKLIAVTEKRTGVAAVLQELHGFSGELPAAKFMNIWSAYTEVTTWVVFFSLISGVYLWLKRPRERKAGTLYLAAGIVGFFIIMLYIWLIG